MPNSTAAKNAEARQKQSEASKRATLDQLVNKPRNTTEFSLENASRRLEAVNARFGAVCRSTMWSMVILMRRPFSE